MIRLVSGETSPRIGRRDNLCRPIQRRTSGERTPHVGRRDDKRRATTRRAQVRTRKVTWRLDKPASSCVLTPPSSQACTRATHSTPPSLRIPAGTRAEGECPTQTERSRRSLPAKPLQTRAAPSAAPPRLERRVDGRAEPAAAQLRPAFGQVRGELAAPPWKALRNEAYHLIKAGKMP